MPPEEQARRAAHLARLKDRYEQLMAEAKREYERQMAEGQTVHVAGFIRKRGSGKGRKSA